MNQMVNSKMQSLMNKNEPNLKPQISATLNPRQDSVYYTQDFANKWSKIESLTKKQLLKGKKGI